MSYIYDGDAPGINGYLYFDGETPEIVIPSSGFGGGGGGHVGASRTLHNRKALAKLFDDIKIEEKKSPEEVIQHALEVVREAQEAVRDTLAKLAELSTLTPSLKVLQTQLQQLQAELDEEEAAVVNLLLL